jgi:iron complex outermembrane recepter protein
MRTKLLAGYTAVLAFFLAVGAAGAAEAAASAAADTATLEEVVVTAEKQVSSIQRTAVSVAAVLGEDIATHGVTQLDEALKSLPGVVISQGPTGFNPTVRGIGPSLPTNLGGDAGISTNYDGVYNNADIFSRAGFYDLARIEVLRGPQGTLYGRNAEGGVLNVVSANPSHEQQSTGGITLGSYNLRQFTGMINMPLSDSLAVRLAASSVKRSGFLSNGQDDNDAQGVRAKLLWTPSEAVSLLVGGEWTNVGGAGIGVNRRAILTRQGV